MSDEAKRKSYDATLNNQSENYSSSNWAGFNGFTNQSQESSGFESKYDSEDDYSTIFETINKFNKGRKKNYEKANVQQSKDINIGIL